jgi:PAS domain S-box-containing protein
MTNLLKIRDKIMGVKKAKHVPMQNPDNSINNSGNLEETQEIYTTRRQQAEAALKESEEKLAKAFRCCPDAIAITTLKEGRFIEINDGFTRITGGGREETLGRTAKEISCWESIEERQRIVKIMKEQGRVNNEEVHLRKKSGEIIIVLFSADPIEIDGKPCMISVAKDITESKRALEISRESEEFSTSLLENAPYPITVINPDTSIKYVNPAFEKLTGFSLAEIVGTKAPFPWWPENRKAERLPGLKGFMAGGSKITQQTIQNKHGDLFRIEINMVRIMHNGEFRYYLAHWSDITEREKVQEIVANEATWRRIMIEQSRDGIVILDQNGKVYEANRQFGELLGYTSDEVLQLHVWDWDDQHTQEQIEEMIHSVDEDGDHFETGWKRKDGTNVDVEISTNGTMVGGQKLVFCVCRDTTERKRAEEALKEAENKYRDLLDNTNELIQSVTPDGRFRYVNNGWKQALGYSDEEIADLSIYDIVHPDYLENYMTIFKKIKCGEDIGQINTAFISKNGSKVVVEGNMNCKCLDGALVYTRSILRDITENKYLEDQMFRLSSAVSMSTDYIVITDFDANIIDVNQKTMEMYGADSKDELLGRHFLELIYPEQRGMVNDDVAKVMEKGSLECREYTMISKQGQQYPVQVSTSLVRDADGKPMGMVRVGREISNS